MSNISGNLSKIAEQLTGYAEDVAEAVETDIQDVAKDTADTLKRTSPKRTGKYASGWRVKTEKKRNNVVSTVYNGRKPGLTHLLEKGHAKRGGGRTRPIPHIRPAEEQAISEVTSRIERDLGR